MIGQSPRRNFLKTAALTGAVAASGLALSRSVHAAGSNVIRIGLVGCGGRGTGAAFQALATGEDVRLMAVGDYFKSRAMGAAASLQEQFPEQVEISEDRIFDGFENDKGVIASDIDVLLIACAAKFHPLYALRGIEAGKHVFAEKPNAMDGEGLATLKQVVEFARKKNLSFLSGLHSRYCLQYAALVDKIHRGMIGEVRTIQSAFLRSPYGVRGYPADMSELDVQVYNQYMFNWLSGDDFTQSLVHNVDRMTWVLDGKTPIAAVGMGGRASMIARDYGDVFDHHHATFYYPEDHCRLFAWCRTEAGCYDEYDDIIIGSRGTAYWNAAKIVGETNWQYEGRHTGGHQEEQTAFFKAIREGNRLDSGDYAINSSAMAILGQVACYTGQRITWDEMVDSEFTFGPKASECMADMEPPVRLGEDGSYPVPVPGVCKYW